MVRVAPKRSREKTRSCVAQEACLWRETVSVERASA
jgi:hypothetical protein